MRSPRLQPFTPRWTAGRQSVVMFLILANVAAFLAQTAAETFAPGVIEQWFALSAHGIATGYIWQFYSYMFLHDGVVHLLVNMLTLYFAGREVEAIAGRRHILGIYFGGGLVGGIAQVVLQQADHPLFGASAGVCAVLIAFTTILPEIEIKRLLFFILPVRMKAKYLAVIIVASSAALAASGVLAGVAHIAHLGGCLVGWLYVKQLGYGNPLLIQKYVFEKRQRAERFARMSPAQFISEEIDPILDKISREGIHSLTRTERKILEKGREKIAEKTSRIARR